MKKNKKLFAILTLVAFMMTLMPVMAFAAVGTTTSAVGVVQANGDLVLTDGSIAANSAIEAVDTVNASAGNFDTATFTGTDLTGITAASGSVTIPATTIAGITADYYVVIGGNGASGSADVSTKYQVSAAIKADSATKYAAYVQNNANAAAAVQPVLEAKVGTVGFAVAPAYVYEVTANGGAYDLAANAATVTTAVSGKAYVGFATPMTTAVAGIASAKVLVVNGANYNPANTIAQWYAYKADPTNTTKLLAYQTANALAAIASPVAGDELTVAQAVARTSDIKIAANLVATLAGGGSGTIPTPTPSGTASVDASIIATTDANATVEVQNDALTIFPSLDTRYAEVDVVFKNASNGSAPAVPVYIWAEESGKSGQASDAFVLNVGTRVEKGDTSNNTIGVYKVTSLTASSNTLKAAFVRGGTYTIKASFANPLDTTAGSSANKIASSVAVLKNVSNKTTVVANSLAQETRLFKVVVEQGSATIDSLLEDGEKTDKNVTVSANTVATSKVTLTVYNKNNSLMTTYPIKLSTNSSNIELDETAITTDYKGQASFNIAGLREGEYKVYVTIGDYEATIMVTVGATSANNIELIKFPSNPIATDTLVADYADIFRFQLTDANGNIVSPGNSNVSYTLNGVAKTGGTTPGAGAATDTAPDSDEAKYVSIVSAPEANKVKNADLYLKHDSGEDYYTLYVDNNKSFSAEGDYEIRVVLDNGKSATLNFTVKKFDKAVSLHIEYPTKAVELNSTTDAPDIYFLDANNVMKKANNRVTVAASGYAVAGIVESGSDAGKLTVKNDEKYIGQTVTVTAASDKENLMASTTLTVADEAREVKLDTTRGQVNANNRVGFKVVDSTGTPVALGNDATVDVTAVVQNTGDADAKVSYSVSSSSKSDLKSNGTGVINLSSNKETTATVQIMVKVSKPLTNANDNNTGLSTTYYTGTETFTFGAEADKSVVMTIGSKEMVANNVPVTTDVAPFIQDNRTYVPFRALTEAFGAEVEYNAENNTVTTKLNGKTVVLTVGSTVLTVNDNTVTMDVAPFIVDDRVVVPVRFVGEAFGFTVEATQDANTGATASVVFYQK